MHPIQHTNCSGVCRYATSNLRILAKGEMRGVPAPLLQDYGFSMEDLQQRDMQTCPLLIWSLHTGARRNTHPVGCFALSEREFVRPGAGRVRVQPHCGLICCLPRRECLFLLGAVLQELLLSG